MSRLMQLLGFCGIEFYMKVQRDKTLTGPILPPSFHFLPLFPASLYQALVEIAEGKIRHVPYRDSKLTFLLKVRGQDETR